MKDHLMPLNHYVEYPPAPPPLPQISKWWGGIYRWLRTKVHLVLLVFLLILNLSVYYFYQNYLSNLLQSEYFNPALETASIYHQWYVISYWGYPLIVIITILKLTTLTFIFETPLLIKNLNIGFKRVFSVLVKAAFVMTAADFLRITNLVNYEMSIESLSVVQITPLGILDLLQTDFYNQASITFLNQFNGFELIWCVIVYFGLLKIKRISSADSLLIVVSVWSLITLFYWGIAAYMEAAIH
jgi:hypothetical protein